MPRIKHSKHSRPYERQSVGDRPDVHTGTSDPKPVRGSGNQVQTLAVTLRQNSQGSCDYVTPATDCLATSNHTAQLAWEVGAPSFLWTIESGTATIVSPMAQTTDVQTTAGSDQTFTLRCTVTDDVTSAFDENTFTHTHTSGDPADSRVTQAGDSRVTQAGDRRVVNG